MKRKISVGVVIALALVLMSVTAVAAGLWGVLDFMQRYGKTVLDGAADTVQTGIPQQGGQTAWANFTLREAVCDGRVAYLILDVTPADEHTLLLFEDMAPDDSARYLSDEYAEETTIAELAEQRGYTNLVWVNVISDREEENFQSESLDAVLSERSMTMILSGLYEGGETEDLSLFCIAQPANGERDTAALTATLHVDAPLWTFASSEPVDYPEAGVRIDGVTLTGTVMGVYADVTYTVTDQAVYDSFDDGFWLELLDEAGEPLPGGAFGMGSMDMIDQEAGIGRLTTDLQAMEQAPSAIGVRAYCVWTKERCQPVTVKLGE